MSNTSYKINKALEPDLPLIRAFVREQVSIALDKEKDRLTDFFTEMYTRSPPSVTYFAKDHAMSRRALYDMIEKNNMPQLSQFTQRFEEYKQKHAQSKHEDRAVPT